MRVRIRREWCTQFIVGDGFGVSPGIHADFFMFSLNNLTWTPLAGDTDELGNVRIH